MRQRNLKPGPLPLWLALSLLISCWGMGLALIQRQHTLPAVESAIPAAPPGVIADPTLDDFWAGRAMWQLDEFDVGLPMGESDTLIGPDGQLWSYLHASGESAGIRDQWGEPVPFPGCVTLWQSSDGGRRFRLTTPACLIQCERNPCSSESDHIEQQQYPRVTRDSAGNFYMVYEWGAAAYLRTSADGLAWSKPIWVPGTGIWDRWMRPCTAIESIGPHPFVDAAFDFDCLSGAPPGIYVEGDQLFVFVGMGQSPGHLGCYSGKAAFGAGGLQPCAANPLFTGAVDYGPLPATDASANAHFDFRTISSADVMRVGERYYLMYEGVRGPGPGEPGDSQFGLGLARSTGAAIDGGWEKYPGNPILLALPGNIGLGHADLIVIEGKLYLYTATSATTRGRYRLAWR